jgi:lysophospholipase
MDVLGINNTDSPLHALEGVEFVETPQELEKQLVPLLLCQASRSGDVKGLSTILSTFSYLINIPDYDGRSALHIASSEGKYKAVEYLLLNGANVHLKDRFGILYLNF